MNISVEISQTISNDLKPFKAIISKRSACLRTYQSKTHKLKYLPQRQQFTNFKTPSIRLRSCLTTLVTIERLVLRQFIGAGVSIFNTKFYFPTSALFGL